MSADSDVATAWASKWDAAGLNTSVGSLYGDEVSETPPDGSFYAAFSVQEGETPYFRSDGNYVDKRRVTVDLYGTGKVAIGTLMSLIHAAYDNPAPLDFSAAPNVVGHMRTVPGVEEKDQIVPGPNQKRRGKTQRVATSTWMVWTHRRGG